MTTQTEPVIYAPRNRFTKRQLRSAWACTTRAKCSYDLDKIAIVGKEIQASDGMVAYVAENPYVGADLGDCWLSPVPEQQRRRLHPDQWQIHRGDVKWPPIHKVVDPAIISRDDCPFVDMAGLYQDDLRLPAKVWRYPASNLRLLAVIHNHAGLWWTTLPWFSYGVAAGRLSYKPVAGQPVISFFLWHTLQRLQFVAGLETVRFLPVRHLSNSDGYDYDDDDILSAGALVAQESFADGTLMMLSARADSRGQESVLRDLLRSRPNDQKKGGHEL